MSKKLDSILAKIQKDYKIEIKSAEETCKVEIVPTDSPSINYVLSGGVPRGRMMAVHGSYSSGKSSLASYIGGQLQKKLPEDQRTVLLFDLEYSFLPEFAQKFGLDTENNFIILQPTSGEDMFEIAKEIIDTGEICLVIIDSISVLASKSQLEDPNKASFGGSARTTSNGLKYLMPYCNKNKCSLFLIAQERDNVGCIDSNTQIEWKSLTQDRISSIKDLFIEGFNLNNPEIGKIYDVADKNIYIKSLNSDTNETIYSKILKATKKTERKMYKLFLEDIGSIRVSEDHVFAILRNKEIIWASTKDLYEIEDKSNLKLLSEILPINIISIEEDGVDYPLDIEVENTHCYFSNGVLSHNSLYGPSYKAAFSGKAVEFYASWIARMNRVEDIKGKTDLEGIRTKIRVEKSKIGINKREAVIDLYFDHGIDVEEDFMNYLKALNIVEQRGAYFYNEEWGMKVQGKQGLKDFLNEHPNIKEKAKKQVNDLICGHTILDNEDSEEDDEEDTNYNPETGEVIEN